MNNGKKFMHTILITLSILAVVGLASYKTFLNQHRQTRYRERKQLLDSSMALGQEVARSIRLASGLHGISVEEFKEKFGKITPDTNRSSEETVLSTYTYYHPESQRTFHLRFQKGRLTGCSSNHGYDDIDTSAVILQLPAYLFSETVRETILSVSLMGWIIILITMFVRAELRPKLSKSLLILALICLICWFLAGHYSPTWRGIRSNDYLVYGIFMLILSLGIQGIKDRPRE